MGTTAESAAEQSIAARLGFKAGQMVQEFGYDDDVDDELRLAIEDLTGNELADEDSQEVVDAAVYWWRDGDGDLVDALVDALGNLADAGVVWLLTPKSGRSGHVEASDIDEAAPTAGLHATSTISVCAEWIGTRLVAPAALVSDVIVAGQPAPLFELPDEHQQSVQLAEILAERHALLIFYPFAFSGICAGELAALRDELPGVERAGVQIVAISCDPMFALRRWAQQEEFGFPLLSDFWPHGRVASDYGVFEEQIGAAGRGSFLIHRDGTVRWCLREELGRARDLGAHRAALASL